MEIVNKKIGELTPYENNPRRNDDAVKYVANSIQEFGFKVPIVIDKDNVIVAGHTRLKAAKKLGLEEVPCIVADDLTDEQIKAFRLADNKVAEFAEWDFNQLGAELAELDDWDMSNFGFEDMIDGDDFGTEFDLPDNDGPLFKNITFTLSEAQFDVINDALQSVELDQFDSIDNENKNGNRLYKVVTEWEDLRRKSR